MPFIKKLLICLEAVSISYLGLFDRTQNLDISSRAPKKALFAIPGSINSFKSTGCHFLIKQGACLVENTGDIIAELGLNCKYISKKQMLTENPLAPMNDSEKYLFNIIGHDPMHIDQIARHAKLEPGEVSSTLLKMELKGIIKQLPGKMFVHTG